MAATASHRLRRLVVAFLLISIALSGAVGPGAPRAWAETIDLIGPPGSEQFGAHVAVLPNGNVVVTDPLYDAPGVANVGAVYLYDGASHALISSATGTRTDDRVGSAGITVLANGNYVIASHLWDSAMATNVGAATWGSATAGIAGPISAANSLVGVTAFDSVGGSGSSTGIVYNNVTALTNGHYVVGSLSWDKGAIVNVGAVTWADGTRPTTGTVSTANSLVGATRNDWIGFLNSPQERGVVALASGDYVIGSPNWDHGALVNAGAVTLADGTRPFTGTLSAANSLVGTQFARAGQGLSSETSVPVTELPNGTLIVRTPGWNERRGAVTWIDPSQGARGLLGPANSLVGATSGDWVGSELPVVLANGNYVVATMYWHNGASFDSGAITWVDATRPLTGTVGPANSLIGTTAEEWLSKVVPLSNGNYVVASPAWDNGALANVGAVAWVDGTRGLTGTLSAANSLVGTTTAKNSGTPWSRCVTATMWSSTRRGTATAARWPGRMGRAA